jgi:hypothetical protein
VAVQRVFTLVHCETVFQKPVGVDCEPQAPMDDPQYDAPPPHKLTVGLFPKQTGTLILPEHLPKVPSELTWILLDGPPAIAMFPVLLADPPPLMERAPDICGFSTKIGMGEVA